MFYTKVMGVDEARIAVLRSMQLADVLRNSVLLGGVLFSSRAIFQLDT